MKANTVARSDCHVTLGTHSNGHVSTTTGAGNKTSAAAIRRRCLRNVGGRMAIVIARQTLPVRQRLRLTPVRKEVQPLYLNVGLSRLSAAAGRTSSFG